MSHWTETGVTEVHGGVVYAQVIETGTRDYHERWIAVNKADTCQWCGMPREEHA